ncbi:MAG: Glycerophosphoryl diester phosphodiesterase family protein [Candidatus Lokiarchaeum sp. GC14_75]|nr:MAG: Glycerophosphoryl diester phosphodiesterase family protein [Candidatus Lokiarchaeum sp. GC14_75]
MSKTFVWGHRGAGFRDIENSMSSFKKAVDMGVDGIKTEAQLSKDGEIFLCFQQSLRKNGEYIPIQDLESNEIRTLRLDNNEPILTLPEFFSEFKNQNIRYNFDIGGSEVGIRIIEIAREFKVIDKIELAKTATDPSPLPNIFGKIREFDKNVILINSIFLKHATNEKEHLELESMRELNIQGINVKYNFATFELFKLVKENGFKFYVWGVLFNRSIKKFLKMNYKGQSVDAMMSNFPDRVVKLRNEIQNN